MKKNLILIFFIGVFFSCGTKQQYSIVSMEAERIPVLPTNNPNPEMVGLVNKYKVQLDREMNIVIGRSSEQMDYGKPESLLTNLTSDVMRLLDKKYTHNEKPDVAVMNVHGHRAPLQKGDITIGNIYEIYSFDNELAIIRMTGEELKSLFKDYARIGGAGISSNCRLIISYNGELISASVDGEPVNNEKIYTVVTLDYLADGNDGFDTFKKISSVEKPGIILRDFMLDYVKKQTAEGKQISSRLDGRIIVE